MTPAGLISRIREALSETADTAAVPGFREQVEELLQCALNDDGSKASVSRAGRELAESARRAGRPRAGWLALAARAVAMAARADRLFADIDPDKAKREAAGFLQDAEAALTAAGAAPAV